MANHVRKRLAKSDAAFHDGAMQIDPHICDRARLARDPRFDGLFFIGVRSTGIFCRPICPAPSPKPEHIVYYPTAAAAMEAGLRPCLRCRPEASPGTPAWSGTSATVSRAMTLIRQGALNEGSLDDLAARLGVGTRHLRRLFKTHVGASPLTLAITQRVLFAKKLITETDLPMTRIAFASGFGSIRRFNAAFRKLYARTPSELRRHSTRNEQDGSGFHCTLRLPYRPPFDWNAMLSFFAQRAIPGVEFADADGYCRTLRIGKATGSLRVTHEEKEHSLLLDVFLSDSRDLLVVVERVRRMFDLDVNLSAIHEVLKADPVLEPLIEKRPGLRLPGAWDAFETAVRAVVGQQVSVKAARTVVGRIAAQAGPPCEQACHPDLCRYFPTADELNRSDLEHVGMPRKRIQTLYALAGEMVSGAMDFCVTVSVADFIKRLTAIAGIGAWTAEYIAMRAFGEPDAFPAGDLGIKRALQPAGGPEPTRRQLLERARSWQPWRAYAAMHLWNR